MVSSSSWVSNLDAFRSVPKDLAEATVTGAGMTFVAVVVCAVLFMCEVTAFMTSKMRTDIVIDSNQDAQLRINFDVHMLDLSCDYVTVGVWDAFGTDKMNITKNVQKQRIDHTGRDRGRPYTEDELVELEFASQEFTKDELAEVNADWSSSSDQFKHEDFQQVIDAHDFTFINFYADWCPHCRNFGPIWTQFEDKVNKKEEAMKDADGAEANVRVLKVNCVDFEETCQEQKISSFPTVRLYRRGAQVKGGVKGFEEYSGPRNMDALTTFARNNVAKRHLHAGATHHAIFQEGCRLSGHVEVARVPGTLHFQAMHSQDKTLNLAFTNVSHHVHHLSFGEAPRRSIHALPKKYKKHVNPVDDMTFIVEKFHQAPQHFIKVVHTRFEAQGIRSYQQTHQWNIRTLQRKTIPQAKFSYDLSPVEVVISKGDRRWYDFLTSCLAIVGGSFTVLSMTAGVANSAQRYFKASINKLG